MSVLSQLKIDLRNRTSMYENQKKRVLELSLEIKKYKEEGIQKDEQIKIQEEIIIRQ